MTRYTTLTLNIDNGLAEITLHRPDNANSINLQMGKELLECAIACESNNEVRAVLLTGSGKMFSAGGDLHSFIDYGEKISDGLTELTTYLHAAIARLRHMDAPVVVAVNGTAAGAGLSLAVCGDYVIASDRAKFTLAYSGVGLSPDGSASYFLPRLIGLRKTQELMMTNRVLGANEAAEWGLINQVVEDDSLMQQARTLASELAQGPTKAYGAVKQLLSQTYSNGLETQMDYETRLIAKMTRTEDGQEGIKAFIEKRRANFTGK